MTVNTKEPPLSVNERLYPFQREDVERLISLPRVLNRNPTGLGKTIETIGLMDALQTSHNLIVCRKTMVSKWFWMINQWLNEGVLTPHDNSQYEHKLSGLDLSMPRFVVVNYDLISMPKYRTILLDVKWDLICFDEAHWLKNHDAQRTRNAYLLTAGVPRVLFLTATPIRNTPMDLFPLFRMMNPREYHNWRTWRDWFCIVEEDEIWMKPKGHTRAVPRLIKRIVPGVKNEDMLRALLNRYSIHHEKSEIFTQLPPKQRKVIPVELGAERAQYETMKEEYFALLDSGVEITAPAAIAQLTRLRQICLDANTLLPEPPRPSTPSNKTLTLLGVIDDTEGKLVVFTYFERYASILSQVFTEKNIEHRIITGKVKGNDRLRAEMDFQNNDNVKVLVGTIGAAGEGIDLTAADVVVFTDLFWGPKTNEQAEDRVHGRADKGLDTTKRTLIIDLFCEGTVEQHVHDVVRAKEQMIERITVTKVVDKMRNE